jgi:hypothetical protein
MATQNGRPIKAKSQGRKPDSRVKLPRPKQIWNPETGTWTKPLDDAEVGEEPAQVIGWPLPPKVQ